eukprot:scaffold18.g2011.t1
MAQERIKKALDSLLYLPHLQAQNEQANLSLGSQGAVGGRGRVWDRGDLFRRLATFKAATWFCKPDPISPVECARRGWVNTGVDVLTCEFCKAKVSCPIPPQLLPEQARTTGERFATKLAEAHDAACPWRNSVCAQSLLQFPPLTQDMVRRDFEGRVANLRQVLCLPPLVAADHSTLPAREKLQLELLLARGLQQRQQHDCSPGEQEQSGGLDQETGPWQTEGTATSESRAFLARARLLALCGWDIRAMSTGNASASSIGGATAEQPQAFVGPESAALQCSLCGVRAGLWGFFPQCKPQIIVAPKPPATVPSGRAADDGRGAAASLGSTVLVDYSTTIAGGSLKAAARPHGVAEPCGAAAPPPVFGAPGVAAAAAGEAAPNNTAAADGSSDGQGRSGGARSASSVPAFGFAALESTAPSQSAPTAAAGGGSSLKRKQQDFSWAAVQADIEAAAGTGKRVRSRVEELTTSTAVPASKSAASTTQSVAAPTPASLAKYRSLSSMPLDPLALHRSYCPWVHCASHQQEGARCGWRWCLQQLVPATEEGDAQPAAVAEGGEGPEGDAGGRRLQWDPATLLRSMLHGVDV